MAEDIFLDKIADLLRILDTGKELADEGLLGALLDNASTLASQYDDIMNEDRDLKIGIVGRVKAGKSSFLNALLFRGEDRLPKAATPMTAALTRITYVDNPDGQEAIAHFYSMEDWGVIQRQARKFNERIEQEIDRAIEQKQNRRGFAGRMAEANDDGDGHGTPEEREEIRRLLLGNLPADAERLKGCAELVEMAARNGVSFASLPSDGGRSNEHRVALGNQSGDFFTKLNDFVGSDGRYTPFVKYLQLRLHHPDLKDIEIIDTPGLNDPVVSRVDVTNRYLKNCDAVLLLSSVSRFLDANDADLAGRQFGEASIKRAYIIGTMVDIGLMECPKRNIGIEEAYAIACGSYEKQAMEFVCDLERINGSLPKGMKKSDSGEDCAWPVLVSSLFYAISRKMRSGEPLNNEEQHVLNRLDALFADYGEKLSTPEDLEDLACFQEVRNNVYEPVRTDKEKILAEKIATFRSGQAANICRQLEDILISSERRKSQLEKNDQASLEKEKKALLDNLQASRIESRNIFNEMIYNCKNGMKDLKVNMRQAMAGHKRIKVESEVKSRSWTTGWLLKNHHFETFTERRASATSATTNLEEYGQECMSLINSAFGDLFNARRLEDKLRRAITDTFRSINEDAGKADILGPVQSLMNDIAVPEVRFDAADEAKKKIYGQFSNEVADGAIGNLEKALSEQLGAIYENYAAQVDRALQEMINSLTKCGATFVDEVCCKVDESYQKLEEQLRDKERNIQLYKGFCGKIKKFKTELSALEV